MPIANTSVNRTNLHPSVIHVSVGGCKCTVKQAMYCCYHKLINWRAVFRILSDVLSSCLNIYICCYINSFPIRTNWQCTTNVIRTSSKCDFMLGLDNPKLDPKYEDSSFDHFRILRSDPNAIPLPLFLLV